MWFDRLTTNGQGNHTNVPHSPAHPELVEGREQGIRLTATPFPLWMPAFAGMTTVCGYIPSW